MQTQTLAAPKPRPAAELAVIPQIARLPAFWLRERDLPRGSERVLMVPGFMTGDAVLWPLRRTLRRLGHTAEGWGLGRNRGDVEALLPRLVEVVHERAQDGPIHLVGWSLGGFLAREVAREVPDHVAQVITMASPVVGGPKYTSAAGYYRRRGVDLDEIEREVRARDSVPIRVPVTALYSERDRVVCPAACIDHVSKDVVHRVVDCSHASFGFSPEVHRIVAEKIAAFSISSARR